MSNNPALKPEWKDLVAHAKSLEGTTMRQMFAEDKARFETFTVKVPGLLFDYSKNRITAETVKKLTALARACDLEGWRTKMFAGEKINATEGRAVLHTACRTPKDAVVNVDGENVIPFVHEVLARMKKFTGEVHSGAWKGHTGKKLSHIVNIGIGGSDLGPYMVCEALKPYTVPGV
ncbi:MAG TPA: glucose-6-phosphate isomerase, partial [Micavibrio sp.]|nr:glucose-6-phosphate isomerase [Micavibrio sp.]